MVEASISAIGYFMPIFAFLLVFIVIYALLVKSQVLGGSPAVTLFVSFILSSFFIVEASLVEFVQFSSAWFGTFVVGMFFLIMIMAFVPGIDLKAFFGTGNWFAWILFGIMILFFVFSSSYIFNWAVNWGLLQDWFRTDWFGMILLLLIAAVVSWKIK